MIFLPDVMQDITRDASGTALPVYTYIEEQVWLTRIGMPVSEAEETQGTPVEFN